MTDSTRMKTRADLEPLLEVTDLKTYFSVREGVVRAVDGLTMTLAKGQTTAVVGESGSGKSITARSVMQLIPKPGKIVGGSIVFHRYRDGKETAVIDISKEASDSPTMRDLRGNDVAMIFQEPMTSFSPVHSIASQM